MHFRVHHATRRNRIHPIQPVFDATLYCALISLCPLGNYVAPIALHIRYYWESVYDSGDIEKPQPGPMTYFYTFVRLALRHLASTCDDGDGISSADAQLIEVHLVRALICHSPPHPRTKPAFNSRTHLTVFFLEQLLVSCKPRLTNVSIIARDLAIHVTQPRHATTGDER